VPREVLTESVENSGGAEDAKEIKEADWIQTIGWRLSGSTSGETRRTSFF